MISNKELLNKLKDVKFVATDFDGVHTDGCVYVSQTGEELVRCSRRDSLGINMLKDAGVDVVVLSKETNPVVSARCRKIGVQYYQGLEGSGDKLDILKKITSERNLKASEVLFVGDDLNDQKCLEWSGVAVTVADGHEKIVSLCDYQTVRAGGDHAIREICELLLRAKGEEIEY